MSYMTNENTTSIYHGIYDVLFGRLYWRSIDYYSIPHKFRRLIIQKGLKWGKEYPLIPFTIGVDGDIKVIAIVHPWDIYKLSLGEDIVKGRLDRQLGLLKRPTYDRIQKTTKDGMLLFETDMTTPLYKEVPPYIITGD